ncbi:MAG: FAD-dependent oxidoreductase, partial [Ruminococcus sp.]|nr:FAD-dependent oxidoreductase [Ruminococcus sp.]
MLRLSQIRLKPGHSGQELEEKIRKLLNLKQTDPLEYRIFKQSIDARKKPEIYYTYTVDVTIHQESRVLSRLRKKKLKAGQVEALEE